MNFNATHLEKFQTEQNRMRDVINENLEKKETNVKVINYAGYLRILAVVQLGFGFLNCFFTECKVF